MRLSLYRKRIVLTTNLKEDELLKRIQNHSKQNGSEKLQEFFKVKIDKALHQFVIIPVKEFDRDNIKSVLKGVIEETPSLTYITLRIRPELIFSFLVNFSNLIIACLLISSFVFPDLLLAPFNNWKVLLVFFGISNLIYYLQYSARLNSTISLVNRLFEVIK